MRRYIFNWLLACLGFLLTVVFVANLMPEKRSQLQRAEASLLGRRSECNVLFVGPSYVKRVLPKYFDKEAKRLGTRDRACKLARSSMRGVELEHELDALLRRSWPKLELVVVDITLGDSVAFEPENWFTHRVINWHTVKTLGELKRYYDFDEGWIKGLIEHGPLLWAHAKHFAANYLEVGDGAAWIGALTSYQAPVPKRKHPKKNYLRDLKHLLKTNEFNEEKRVFGDSRWPLALRERIRAHGYEAAFLFSPVWEPTRLPRRAVTGRDPLQVMDFAQPRKYRTLYRKRARGATSHLKAHVGPQFSRELARAVANLDFERKPKGEGGKRKKAHKKKGHKKNGKVGAPSNDKSKVGNKNQNKRHKSASNHRSKSSSRNDKRKVAEHSKKARE